MRKEFCLLVTTAILILLQLHIAQAQAVQSAPLRLSTTPITAEKAISPPGEAFKSTRIQVTMKEMTGSDSSVEWFSQADNELSLRILKSLQPIVKIPPGFKMWREIDGEAVVFTFFIQADRTPIVEWKANVLEITFVPSAPSFSISNENSKSSPKGKVDDQVLPAQTSQAQKQSEDNHNPLMAARVPENERKPIATLNTAPPPPLTTAKPVAAQGGSSIPTTPTVKEANIDLAVPESPAFTVLGLTPDTVIQPSSPQELVTSLLNGVDQNGNFQSGIALDTVPYLLFAGDQVTLNDYQNSYMTRLLSRTQLSIASTKGASESDKSARLALGFRLTLWDDGDPRMDKALLECLNNGLRQATNDLIGAGIIIPPNQIITPEMQAKIDAATASAKAMVVACRQQSRKNNWNGSSFTIGAAPSWISTQGSVGDLMWNGGAVWASLAYGFKNIPALSKTAQLILHARYRTKEQIADPDHQGQFLVQDSSLFGGRLRAGTADFGFNFEGVYMHNHPEGQSSDNTYRLSFGAERRVAKDLWFNISVGGQGGRSDGKSNTFVLTSFKWNFSKDPQFGGIPPR